MRRHETPENEATRQAMVANGGMVLVPGLLFAFGAIWLAMPRYKPPPRNWADGTYVNICCAPLVLRDGKATAEDRATSYVVEQGKIGMELSVPQGIGVRQGKVEFSESNVLARFLGPRTATHGKPEALRLFGVDDHLEYIFVRQERLASRSAP